MFPLAWLAIYTAQHSWALRSVLVHMCMWVFLKGLLAALPRAHTFLYSMGEHVAHCVGEMCAFRAGALCLCLVVALSVGVVVTRQRSALRLLHWRPGGLKRNVAERGLLVMMFLLGPHYGYYLVAVALLPFMLFSLVVSVVLCGCCQFAGASFGKLFPAFEVCLSPCRIGLTGGGGSYFCGSWRSGGRSLSDGCLK